MLSGMHARLATGLTAALVSGGLLLAQPAAPPGEQIYDIHLIERQVGSERDTITDAGAGQHLESRLAIVDRGTPLDVSASVTVAADYTPRAVTVTGKTYRFVNVDLAVQEQALGPSQLELGIGTNGSRPGRQGRLDGTHRRCRKQRQRKTQREPDSHGVCAAGAAVPVAAAGG